MTAADPRAAAPAPPRAEQIRRHQWLATLGQAVRTPRGAIGLGLVCVVAAIAAIGPFVAPHPSDTPLTPYLRDAVPAIPPWAAISSAAMSCPGSWMVGGCYC